MATPKNTPKTPKKPPVATLPVDSAEESFRKRRPAIEAVPMSETKAVTVDVQQASMVALGVHDLLHKPEHEPVIAALAKLGIIDRALIDGLADTARATWYARHKLIVASAVHTEAALPLELLEPALACRSRMRKSLEYNLEGHVKASTLLTQLRIGTGHLDLANDLLGYADMYVEHDEAIELDPKNYRATDEPLARRLSDEITTALGVTATPEQTTWKNLQARAFVLLKKHYEESVRLGQFLYYYENPDELFPSMFTASRAAPSSRDKTAEPAKAPDDAPKDPEKEPT